MIVGNLGQNLEWLSSNMHRNYPLQDSLVAQSLTGEYLPSSFLIDLQLVIPYVQGLNKNNFFISAINRSADAFQVIIGYQIQPGVSFDCAASSAIPIGMSYTGNLDSCEVALSPITIIPDTSGPSRLQGIPRGSGATGIYAGYEAMTGLRGSLYIGTCDDMRNTGSMMFLYENAAIMPTCIYMESQHIAVKNVTVMNNGGDVLGVMSEDFTIKAGTGINLEVNGSTVTVSVSDDYQQEIRSQIIQDLGNAIFTINGVYPLNGNIDITGMDCTLVENQEHGISISNPCAKPCCDSDGMDTAEILTAMQELSTAKDRLENYFQSMATNINLMQARLASLIASRT